MIKKMTNPPLAKSAIIQKLTPGLAVVACLVLAIFIIRAPAVLADSPAESRANPSSASENYKYSTPQPLIISRPIVVDPPSGSAETDPSPQSQAGPKPVPQEDQSQPATETDTPNITGDEVLPPEIGVEVSEGVDSVVAISSPESSKTNQPPKPNVSSSSNLRNTRAVLWGIVASMAAMLILGSFVFQQKDED